MRFQTTMFQTGNNTGIEVPAEVLEALGGGRRPAVRVTLGDYSFASTVGAMGGRSLIPFSAEKRRLTGIGGGDALQVDIELDTSSREMPVPADLAGALESAAVTADFAALAPSARKAHIVSVDGAKAEATRARRIDGIVQKLLQARPGV
jgi:hypothetical protein